MSIQGVINGSCGPASFAHTHSPVFSDPDSQTSKGSDNFVLWYDAGFRKSVAQALAGRKGCENGFILSVLKEGERESKQPLHQFCIIPFEKWEEFSSKLLPSEGGEISTLPTSMKIRKRSPSEVEEPSQERSNNYREFCNKYKIRFVSNPIIHVYLMLASGKTNLAEAMEAYAEVRGSKNGAYRYFDSTKIEERRSFHEQYSGWLVERVLRVPLPKTRKIKELTSWGSRLLRLMYLVKALSLPSIPSSAEVTKTITRCELDGEVSEYFYQQFLGRQDNSLEFMVIGLVQEISEIATKEVTQFTRDIAERAEEVVTAQDSLAKLKQLRALFPVVSLLWQKFIMTQWAAHPNIFSQAVWYYTRSFESLLSEEEVKSAATILRNRIRVGEIGNLGDSELAFLRAFFGLTKFYEVFLFLGALAYSLAEKVDDELLIEILGELNLDRALWKEVVVWFREEQQGDDLYIGMLQESRKGMISGAKSFKNKRKYTTSLKKSLQDEESRYARSSALLKSCLDEIGSRKKEEPISLQSKEQ